MKINTVEDIEILLMNRDNLSRAAAIELVDSCLMELYEIINDETCDLWEVEQCVNDWLGLEPDYLDILLNELI